MTIRTWIERGGQHDVSRWEAMLDKGWNLTVLTTPDGSLLALGFHSDALPSWTFDHEGLREAREEYRQRAADEEAEKLEPPNSDERSESERL